MRLTKFEHSCVLVDDVGARILIDPGVYSHGFEELTGLTAILVTHQHPDHLDLDRVRALLDRNDSAQLYADSGSAAVLADAGISATAVAPGQRLDVGVTVDVHGGEHAVIHPDVPVIPNLSYLVGDRFFHPGDSFTVPDADVEVLGVPIGAPWLKAAEAVDYLRAVGSRVAIPIHEAVLAIPSMHYGLLERLAPAGSTVRIVEARTTITL